VLLDTFWISVRGEYPEILENALKMLMQFSVPYLCELGFSTLTDMKWGKKLGGGISNVLNII
jgi:hypothetical protein